MSDAYEQVPYPARPLRRAHIDNLATAARLRGVPAAPPDHCRVLEVGCSDGGHLLPMAVTLPGSRFAGIDLAANAVREGQRLVAALQLDNLQLAAADLLDWDPGPEPFDYVIAHGLYSWIPEPVRDRLLATISRCLAPNGVAYVSYNIYPGCFLRKMMAGMMHYHVDRLPEPAHQIRQARELVKFLVAGQPETGYESQILRNEATRVLAQSDSNVFHDDLAAVNHPVYFHEFAAHARSHGLRYLGESEAIAHNYQQFPAEILGILDQMTYEDREQYIDFLKVRRFRASLLVREAVEVQPRWEASQIDQFLIACPLKPVSESPSLAPGAVEEFRDSRSLPLSVDHPLSKAALLRLGRAFPGSIPFSGLAQAAASDVPPSESSADHLDALRTVLARGHLAGVVELHTHQPPWANCAGDRPTAGKLILYQARQRHPFISSLRHTAIDLDDPLAKFLIPLLDGSLDREALRSRLVEAGLALSEDSQAVLNRFLEAAAGHALLVS